jgi:hypothetical protein
MRFKQISLVICIMLMAALASLGLFKQADAQGVAAQLCVVVYEDDNGSNNREATELLLIDANINLLSTSNVVLANVVTMERAPYCFPNLPAGQYMISVSGRGLTPPIPLALTLRDGERLIREVGVQMAPAEGRQPTGDNIVVPLTTGSRVALAGLAGVLIILLMSGLGLVVYGILFYKRTDRLAPQEPVENENSPRPARRASKPQTREFVSLDDDDDDVKVTGTLPSSEEKTYIGSKTVAIQRPAMPTPEESAEPPITKTSMPPEAPKFTSKFDEEEN